jgi:NADPH:quinone reductase-like Zn-dependent oxidoreductase
VRAVVITRHGGPEVLRVEERPDPPVGPGDLRIRVRAAGINFADLMARAGTYPDAPSPPSVVGYEVAGEVESVGEGVEAYAPGDRVLAGTRFGGYAELVTVPAGSQVLPLPDSFSFEQGAAFPVNYATAYAALVIMGGLKPDERVLIHAAAGGVGIAATQIARGIGAEILGTASAGKHDAIREQGVAHPIDYKAEDFADAVRRITGGEGVDLVLDAVGPSSFRRSYSVLRQGGRLVMYGLSEAQPGERRDLRALAGALVRMPLATLPWWRSLAVMNENKGVFGLNMLKWWDREGLDRAIDPLREGLAAGRFQPVVAASFPFEQAADAHRYLTEARNVGKVVLVPEGGA